MTSPIRSRRWAPTSLLAGDEGRHAAVVRRIRPGEMIMIGDGRGRGVRGMVVEVRPSSVVVEVARVTSRRLPSRGASLPCRRWPRATGRSWQSR